MNEDKFIAHFIEVPPPEQAPTDELGEAYGLPKGLHFDSTGDEWRCASCSVMQKPDSPLVWVPDGVRRGDPEWSVTESARRNAYNGHSSGWCLKCAQTLKEKPPSPVASKPRSFWKRLLGAK
jgi:hypothetical protein